MDTAPITPLSIQPASPPVVPSTPAIVPPTATAHIDDWIPPLTAEELEQIRAEGITMADFMEEIEEYARNHAYGPR